MEWLVYVKVSEQAGSIKSYFVKEQKDTYWKSLHYIERWKMKSNWA